MQLTRDQVLGLTISTFILFILLVCLVTPVVAELMKPASEPKTLTQREADDMLLSALVILVLFFVLGSVTVLLGVMKDRSSAKPLPVLLAVIVLCTLGTMSSAFSLREDVDPVKVVEYKQLVQASMGLVVSYVAIILLATMGMFGNSVQTSAGRAHTPYFSTPRYPSYGYGFRSYFGKRRH